jgi:UDP-GlcNAc3NAcA epimerase
MIKMVLVLGARPQIIKSVLLVKELSNNSTVDLKLIHTGQHYDYEMSQVFFEELGLFDSHVNLGVGSGSHAYQTSEMMIRLEKVLIELKPHLLIVPGDTNSTLAGALTAAKLQVKVAHVEAGCRSYDMSMPEEINRRITDHISSQLFSPSQNCFEHPKREGVLGRVYVSGDTMFDVLLKHMPLASRNRILEEIDIEPRSYAFLTLHRAENVDNPFRLRNIIKAITRLDDIHIIFPIHPRTMDRLTSLNLLRKLREAKHVKLLKPLSYHEMLKLISEAKLVLTDSGGVQKEAFWLKVLCITLRENTEWIETVKLGVNFLAGSNIDKILSFAKMLVNDEDIRNRIKALPNPYGNGAASKNIAKFIIENFNSEEMR